MVKGRVLLICFAACLLAAPLAQADYYFYGVASDDFTPDNDTLWAALEPYPEWDASRSTLYDNRNVWAPDGQDSVYSDLQGYANTLVSGDVFLFSDSGHGGWGAVDFGTVDEGTTPRPTANDPSPSSNPPYQYDEWLAPPPGGNDYVMFDDDITDAFANFDDCVEVVVLSGACHSGGWVGGSHDIDNSVPASNNGLYAILGAPEQGYGIGVGPVSGPYEILLTTALSNTLDAYMTMSDWYDDAMGYGETNGYWFEMDWDSSPQWYKYWPTADWDPTTYEDTYWTDHWGWEETYLQLRPEDWSSLDTAHDHWMGTPEPATTTLLTLGLLALGARLRRQKAD